MTDHSLPPPTPLPPTQATPVPATESQWYVAETAPPPVASSGVNVWAIVALAAGALSIAGNFMTILSVRGRDFDRGGFLGVPVPWRFREQMWVIALFNRWDYGVALMVVAMISALVVLVRGRTPWLNVIGAVCAGLSLHLMASFVERAELQAVSRFDQPTYELGGILLLVGPFVVLMSTVAMLARRD